MKNLIKIKKEYQKKLALFKEADKNFDLRILDFIKDPEILCKKLEDSLEQKAFDSSLKDLIEIEGKYIEELKKFYNKDNVTIIKIEKYHSQRKKMFNLLLLNS